MQNVQGPPDPLPLTIVNLSGDLVRPGGAGAAGWGLLVFLVLVFFDPAGGRQATQLRQVQQVLHLQVLHLVLVPPSAPLPRPRRRARPVVLLGGRP